MGRAMKTAGMAYWKKRSNRNLQKLEAQLCSPCSVNLSRVDDDVDLMKKYKLKKKNSVEVQVSARSLTTKSFCPTEKKITTTVGEPDVSRMPEPEQMQAQAIVSMPNRYIPLPLQRSKIIIKTPSSQFVLSNPQPSVTITEVTSTPEYALVPLSTDETDPEPEVITLESDGEMEENSCIQQYSTVIPANQFDFLIRTIVSEITKGNAAYVDSWQHLLLSLINQVSAAEANSHWTSLNNVTEVRNHIHAADVFMRQIETLLLERARGTPPQ